MRFFIEYKTVLMIAVLMFTSTLLPAQKKFKLENSNLLLEWQQAKEGLKVSKVQINASSKVHSYSRLSGAYTVLYSDTSPAEAADKKLFSKNIQEFPDSSYLLIYKRWTASLNPVALNTAGTAFTFFPDKVREDNGKLIFEKTMPNVHLSAVWELDNAYSNDVKVEIELTAQKDGYYSIQTPSLLSYKESDLSWGMIPGHFQGNSLQKNLVLSYAYGQGIPNIPVVARERTASTLSPLITDKTGITMAVIPEPGTGRDPWEHNKTTQNNWLLGLSLMNRNKELTPTLYHPVLGQKGSYMKKGERKVFRFRYTIKPADWYNVYKHAVNDIYKFSDFLSLKKTNQSLTSRVLGMLDYVKNDSTSLWHTYNYKGLEIGAQEYNGPIMGSNKDAVKNSDYGAMWMLGHITGDSTLLKNRLPYARNFKLVQQDTSDAFFKGAAIGQYYLWKSKKFTEEWGNYVEPIALTYYTLLDIGNILLFEKDDIILKERLRLAANRLLKWQQPDGSWVVAYDHNDHAQRFADLKDLRATFYGCMVAYRILGDKKYLDAAIKGADWFIKNAVDKGHFLGVCGDFRFVPDFATGQSVQALLDLFELTKNKIYKDAAIKTAHIYTASIYTHPIPTQEIKIVGNHHYEDWQISQVGLSFEHGGTLGSAAKEQGPILLASHAGMFVRLYSLTGDSLFLKMARAAAWGRDAFVNKNNSVASYYWNGFDNGPGKFPHHAWWQIGWITDYLLSEIELRSEGNIRFPRGFITPKVGPHQSYGFQQGSVYGEPVSLIMKPEVVQIENPYIDYCLAENKSAKKIYLILLNNSTKEQHAQLNMNYSKLSGVRPLKVHLLTPDNKRSLLRTDHNWNVTIPASSLRTIELEYEERINDF